MSTLAIVLLVAGAIFLLLFVGGLVASRRRDARNSVDYMKHVAAADHALEQARAQDRGWDREVMEGLVREALAGERPGRDYTALHLVLVDDQPGVHQDRAHFVATSADGDTRIVLERGEEGWAVTRLE